MMAPVTEELTSRTETDLLNMTDEQLLEQQPLSGMSLDDLRHFPSDAYHSETRQQNGSVGTRPLSYSEISSDDLLTSWSRSLAERDSVNFNRTMSTNPS